jgi:hypothetical protein
MKTLAPSAPLNTELEPGNPPLLRVDDAGDATEWVSEHRETLRAFVAEHGSLLIRGLGLRDATSVAAVFRQFGQLMAERESFAERREYAEGVYSSTKWPANQPMCMHHELSYMLEPPGLMLFACLVAPSTRGATAIADGSAVLDALPKDLVERVERDGWLLVRNYNDEIGASLAESFGTDDRDAVERYCRANAIRFEWQPGGGLRTWQRRRAIQLHAPSGKRTWFNQIAFLNEWTVAPEVREYLVDEYGADALPFNTQFGDGEPIGADVVQLIHDAYQSHTVREAWQAGDLLVVDNIRMAHAREPFEGPREVLVGMADPVRLDASLPADQC